MTCFSEIFSVIEGPFGIFSLVYSTFKFIVLLCEDVRVAISREAAMLSVRLDVYDERVWVI